MRVEIARARRAVCNIVCVKVDEILLAVAAQAAPATSLGDDAL